MSAEDAVATAQSAFMKAMSAGDRAGCDALLASEFSELRPNDDHTVEVILRDAWLDGVAASAVKHVSVTDTVVAAHGPVAIATVLWLEDGQSDPQRRCETNVWTCLPDGGWLLIERHTAWFAASK